MRSGGYGVQKYVPTPQAAAIILDYFRYNNFQDFNTWQQLSRTKVDYVYQEKGNRTQCVATLKWDDRRLPSMNAQASGSVKRTAKKRVQTRLIEHLINQGYIGMGFRQANFLEKLPRRRRSDSEHSASSEDESLLGGKAADQWRILLLKGDRIAVLKEVSNRGNLIALIECANYALREGDMGLLGCCLRAYRCGYVSQFDGGWSGMHGERQTFDSGAVKPPLPGDLTDYIRCCQLQKDYEALGLSQQQVEKIIKFPDPPLVSPAAFKPRPLPSQQILSKLQSPTKQTFIKFFHPIESTISLCQARIANNEVQLPRFQAQQRDIPLKVAQKLFQLVPFYCNQEMVQEVMSLFEEELRQVDISMTNKQDRQWGEGYYRRMRPLLAAEFGAVVWGRVKEGSGVSIEGMLLPAYSANDGTFIFNPTEPAEIVAMKVNKKANHSELQEHRQISVQEYVLLEPKGSNTVKRKLIGQVLELTPYIKIRIPGLLETLQHPQAMTIRKLYNSKPLRRGAASLLTAIKHCRSLIQAHTTLIWQPPTFPVNPIIVQLLTDWQHKKHTTLVLTLNPQPLRSSLQELGIKTVAVSNKQEEKSLPRGVVVVTSPSGCLSDNLKNSVFERVLILEAQQVPQIMGIAAIVKGCQELYLLGDLYFPQTQALSQHARSKEFSTSLFVRLFNEGRKFVTFDSRVEDNRMFANVMQWANSKVYGGNLRLLCQESSLIKGVPWPSTQFRVCLLHLSNPTVKEMVQAAISLMSSVLGSGYTNPSEISCSVCHQAVRSELRDRVKQLLLQFQDPKAKKEGDLVWRMCHEPNGSQFTRGQLSIVLVSRSIRLGEILAGLCEGRRGVMFIGDIGCSESEAWLSFVKWCHNNRLICHIGSLHS